MPWILTLRRDSSIIVGGIVTVCYEGRKFLESAFKLTWLGVLGRLMLFSVISWIGALFLIASIVMS